MLPSQAILNCDTFDLMVLDIGAKWANRDPDEKKEPTQDELLEMVRKAREQNADS